MFEEACSQSTRVSRCSACERSHEHALSLFRGVFPAIENCKCRKPKLRNAVEPGHAGLSQCLEVATTEKDGCKGKSNFEKLVASNLEMCQ